MTNQMNKNQSIQKQSIHEYVKIQSWSLDGQEKINFYIPKNANQNQYKAIAKINILNFMFKNYNQAKIDSVLNKKTVLKIGLFLLNCVLIGFMSCIIFFCFRTKLSNF